MANDASRQGITQTIATTGTTASATNPFGAQTYQIRLVANTACHIRIYDATGNATATAADPFLPANWYEYLKVSPGQKISSIRAATGGLVTATDGTVWVTEMIS